MPRNDVLSVRPPILDRVVRYVRLGLHLFNRVVRTLLVRLRFPLIFDQDRGVRSVRLACDR